MPRDFRRLKLHRPSKQKRDLPERLALAGPRFLLIWTTIVFALAMFRGESSIQKYLSLKDSEVLLRKAVNQLEDANHHLELEINQLKSSPIYARKVLRDRYHVTEEGEKIIYFAD